MKSLGPRLHDHIFARRHRIDGVEQVALHDSRSGALVLVTPSDWELIAVADGARDVKEIADSLLGNAKRTEAKVAAFFDDLDREGLLTTGPGETSTAPEGQYAPPSVPDRSDRVIERLPEYELICDGLGDCCSQYASIVLTRPDVERARSAGLACEAPGSFSKEALMPFAGARSERVALPIVDGACSELTSSRRCGLHERGGERAKPVACAWYPATFVDDGEVVRASIACECSCVFRSVGRGADRAVEEFPVMASDLPEALTIRGLSDHIFVTSGVAAARTDVVAWSKRALREPEPEDVIVRLLAEADALATVARNAADLASTKGSGSIDIMMPSERLLLSVASFAARAASAATSADAWRSSNDRTRILRRALAEASGRALTDEAVERLCQDRRWSRDEAFFYRASLHGYAFVDCGSPLVTALENAAVSVVVARALGQVEEHASHPLAIVLAMRRGMGA